MSTKKIVTVITGIFETVCVGGVIYGWGSMNYILTEAGYYACDFNATSTAFNHSSQTICPDQQYKLELVFTLSVVLSLIITVFGGVILDRYGTLVVRNLNTFIFTVSCISIAYSTPNISWILFPGMISMATSGFFLYVTNLQTANLFPEFRGTIVNLINGALAASLVVFTLAKTAYESAIDLKTIFVFLALGGLPLMARSYFLMPKSIIPYNVPIEFQYGIHQNCCRKKCTSENSYLLEENCSSENNIDRDVYMTDVNLKTCLLNVTYMLGVLTLVVQLLRITFFIESLNGWLKHLLPHNHELISRDISIFGYIQLSAFVLAPLNGVIFDLIYRFYSKKNALTKIQVKLKSLAVLHLIACLTSITYSVFVLIKSPLLQYGTFVLAVTANVFPVANFSLLLIHCFPMKYFGILYGLGISAVGVVTILQYPLLYIGLHYFAGNFFVVNLILFILVVIALAQPIYLYKQSMM